MPADLQFLATSKNNIPVSYDPVDSHATTHFSDTPQLKGLTIEIINGTNLLNDVEYFEKDIGRVVGNSDEVRNDPNDEIVYAKQLNRDVFTSFNKSKSAFPCSLVSLYLVRQIDGSYELQSAWIGSRNSPPFPGDAAETPESLPYWTTHSLAWGTQKIQPGTETTICPWV